MKIVVIDGKGGKMGSAVIEMIVKEKSKDCEIYAIGTNGVATSAMLKSGADFGATGENPVVVASRDADFIIAPIGIVIADSLFGEVTPKMAVAVGQSKAYKILLPVNRCNHHITGVKDYSITEYIEEIKQIIKLHV
ncbi:MAG: DUF3842 family protein [Bacillota bacterium]